MTLFEASDYQKLYGILQRRTDFQSESDRRRLLVSAFAGVPRGDVVLSGLDVSGAPRGASVAVIMYLERFSYVEKGRHALSPLFDEMLATMGVGDDADFLSDLIVKYKLKPATPPSMPSVPLPSSVAAGDKYLFISYARPDQPIAEQVEAYLNAAGFRTFRDVTDIPKGANWDMTIEQALKETTDMVLLLSDSSMPYRKEVHREWFYYDQEQKPIKPLYIQDCKLHSRLYTYNYTDARGRLGAALQDILAALLK